MTNKTFSETNKFFLECCQHVDIPNTVRQASKFRMKRGLAYNSKAIFYDNLSILTKTLFRIKETNSGRPTS